MRQFGRDLMGRVAVAIEEHDHIEVREVLRVALPLRLLLLLLCSCNIIAGRASSRVSSVSSGRSSSGRSRCRSAADVERRVCWLDEI